MGSLPIEQRSGQTGFFLFSRESHLPFRHRLFALVATRFLSFFGSTVILRSSPAPLIPSQLPSTPLLFIFGFLFPFPHCVAVRNKPNGRLQEGSSPESRINWRLSTRISGLITYLMLLVSSCDGGIAGATSGTLLPSAVLVPGPNPVARYQCRHSKFRLLRPLLLSHPLPFE